MTPVPVPPPLRCPDDEHTEDSHERRRYQTDLQKRHGFFNHLEALAEVKGFPAAAINRIKQRVTLAVPGEVEVGTSPRRLKATHSTRTAKKGAGYSRKIRSTTRSDKLRRSA